MQNIGDRSTHPFDADLGRVFVDPGRLLGRVQRLEHCSFKFETAGCVRQDGPYGRKAGDKLALYPRLRETVEDAEGCPDRIFGKSIYMLSYFVSRP